MEMNKSKFSFFFKNITAFTGLRIVVFMTKVGSSANQKVGDLMM